MSRERLPHIGSSARKAAPARPSHPSPALQRPYQANRGKRSQQKTSSSSSSSHPGPPAVLLSDTTMTPWGGLAFSESSFTSIPPPPPPPPPPTTAPPSPAPQPTPSTPRHGRPSKDEEEELLSSFNSPAPSPPVAAPLDGAGGGGRLLRVKQSALPQHRVSRPAHLPPLRPITNLSFSRSFTFSFFELPLHQSPRCRAERIRNLMLLLRQTHY